MKKRVLSLVLTLVLAVGLVPSAFAAPSAAQAISAFESYFSVGGETRDLPDSNRPSLVSFFYVDFNHDGIPEVMRYFSKPGETDVNRMAADVFCVTGSGSSLAVKQAAAFGTGGNYDSFSLVRYADGSYAIVQFKIPESEYDVLGNPIRHDPIEDYFVFSNGSFSKAEKRPCEKLSAHNTANRFAMFSYKPTVMVSDQKLKVNGQEIKCEKYNIDGSNYFKLRDIAKLMSGTANQFEVGWDAKSNLISITRGASYTPNGTELFIDKDNSESTTLSTQKLMIDGITVSDLSTFNIGGNNYFKLRDLGNKFGFNVGWDAATSTVVVTSTDYKG